MVEKSLLFSTPHFLVFKIIRHIVSGDCFHFHVSFILNEISTDGTNSVKEKQLLKVSYFIHAPFWLLLQTGKRNGAVFLKALFFVDFQITVIFSLWLPEVLQQARIVTRFFYSQDMIFILRKPEFLLEVF
jgi:hypothetical protein